MPSALLFTIYPYYLIYSRKEKSSKNVEIHKISFLLEIYDSALFIDFLAKSKEAASRPMMDSDITGTTNERLAGTTPDRTPWHDTDTGAVPIESEEATPPGSVYSDRGRPRTSQDIPE
ncbi:MAG TPA: hypothetical protein VKY19_05300 [Ktedonosporobacter sp.]|nr:hypothetical protein [Ktedonosporobacter sp.]